MAKMHDVPKTFGVSVARPKYYMYYFPKGIDHVLLRVTSLSNTCMTVSVQKIKCPVFDLEMNVEYDGKYQTMSTQATMLLRREDYPDINGFYIVFITKANDKDCSGHVDSEKIVPNSVVTERRKIVNIIITDTITTIQYWRATSAAVCFFLMFYFIAFVILCLCRKCGLPGTFAEMSPEDMEEARSLLERVKAQRLKVNIQAVATSSGSSSGNGDQFLLPRPNQSRYGAMENGDLDTGRSYRRELSAVSNSSALIDEAAIDFLSDADFEKDVFRTKRTLHVSDLARKKRTKLAKIYRTFYW
ncbi:SID1 transmembrane family member 2-like [Elysia marginata]|uniref:SID1 transmembrane family member 2-like n=1 Tax=Elysia marginata TaxID=1093978 RepID=A0AAV4FSR3_9GAST|nr:SID1 transmembrane family member 2-like [Elysia marginata]